LPRFAGQPPEQQRDGNEQKKEQIIEMHGNQLTT
jgi:hypothetical protein